MNKNILHVFPDISPEVVVVGNCNSPDTYPTIFSKIDKLNSLFTIATLVSVPLLSSD